MYKKNRDALSKILDNSECLKQTPIIDLVEIRVYRFRANLW